MQLSQLKYAVTVAEEGQFTKAAAKLNVAQPSVSSAIAALEKELGAPLFHRSRGRIVPTAAGATFLPWARQALADTEAGIEAVREVAGLRRGKLSLGATPSLTTHVLPSVLAAFHSAYPSIELHVFEAGSRDLVQRLEQAQLDLALVILPVNESWLSAGSLFEEDPVLAVSKDHPLAVETSIDSTMLAGLPLVMFRDGYDLRQATLAACKIAGIEPTFVAEGLEMDGALALVSAGLGVAVVPSSVVNNQGPIVGVPFSDPLLRRTVGTVTRRDRPLSPAGKAFVDYLRASIESKWSKSLG